MSFSKNVSAYDPEWEAVLVQLGSIDSRDRVRIGPFETRGSAVAARHKFNYYCTLVRVPGAPVPNEAIQGSFRATTSLFEELGHWWFEVYDRHAYGPQVHGLKVKPRTNQDAEVARGLEELERRRAEFDKELPPADAAAARKYY